MVVITVKAEQFHKSLSSKMSFRTQIFFSNFLRVTTGRVYLLRKGGKGQREGREEGGERGRKGRVGERRRRRKRKNEWEEGKECLA